MSFEGKRQTKHTVDELWFSPQPASIRRGDLRKGHILRKSRKGWAPEYLLPVAEVQAPDMTTIKKLPPVHAGLYSCRSSAAKVQKRLKEKRRKLWLREHASHFHAFYRLRRVMLTGARPR
jgi:hypothetical protein